MSNKTSSHAAGGSVGIILGATAGLLALSFIIMILSGVVGHSFDNHHFFISFAQSIVVAIVLAFVSAFFRND